MRPPRRRHEITKAPGRAAGYSPSSYLTTTSHQCSGPLAATSPRDPTRSQLSNVSFAPSLPTTTMPRRSARRSNVDRARNNTRSTEAPHPNQQRDANAPGSSDDRQRTPDMPFADTNLMFSWPGGIRFQFCVLPGQGPESQRDLVRDSAGEWHTYRSTLAQTPEDAVWHARVTMEDGGGVMLLKAPEDGWADMGAVRGWERGFRAFFGDDDYMIEFVFLPQGGGRS